MATGGDEFDRTIVGGSEPFYEFICSLCEAKGRNVEAEKYCQDCHVFMCSACVMDHNRFPLNTAHLLLTKHKFTGVKKPVSFPTRRCLTHPGELISIYCGNHDVVCCSSCKVFEHSNCRKLQHLTDAAKGVLNTQEYKDIKTETKDVIADVNNVLADRNADIGLIEDKKQNIMQTIIDYRKKIDKYFDDLEKQSLEELGKIAQKIVEVGEQDIKELTVTKSNAENILSQIESFTGDNECDLFVRVKMAKLFLSDTKQKLQDVSENVQKDDINFRIDPKFEHLFSSVKALGTFNVVTLATGQFAKTLAETNTSQGPKVSASQRMSPTNPSLLPEYKVQLYIKANTEEKSDTKMGSVISDICQMSDGTILVTDSANKKLKRLDQTYQRFDSVRLPSLPHSVCYTGNGEVAVSMCKAKKIQFVSVGKKLKLIRSFRTGGYCRGMAYVDGKLFVCCGDDHTSSGCIEVYNISGKLERSIENKQIAPNESPSITRRIADCGDGQHLLVNIHMSDYVTMMDLNGKVVNTFRDSNLKGVNGLCANGNGQVFICGIISNTVVQLDPKHQTIDVILREDDGMKEPRAVCYDKKHSRLLISCFKSNEMLVFSLI